MSENKNGKKPQTKQETAEAAAAAKQKLEKSNSARLAKFATERSSERQGKFKVVTTHPHMNRNDSCAVVGTVNFVSYSHGYVKMSDAETAVKQLNEQYF